MYFDVEYDRLRNPDKNHKQLMYNLVEIVSSFCKAKFGLPCLREDVIILDSVTEKKVSYHLIFKTIVFADNTCCKQFVNYIVENLSHENLEKEAFKITNLAKLGQVKYDLKFLIIFFASTF